MLTVTLTVKQNYSNFHQSMLMLITQIIIIKYAEGYNFTYILVVVVK